MAMLSETIVGTWELISREDRTRTGEIRTDSALGADPLGLLIYDRGGRFAAQFMQRDRSAAASPAPAPTQSSGAPNNTRASNGYDAYFGTYSVNEQTGMVTQTLLAALAPENVGHVVERRLVVEGDALTIELETAAADGEPVTRTLKWRRVA